MARTKQTARKSTCGCGCGTLTPIKRNTDDWNVAKRLTDHITFLHADQMNYALKYPLRLLRAFRGGRTYGVTFRAKGADGVTASYSARVFVNDHDSFYDLQIDYFAKVAGSETPEKKKKVAPHKDSSISGCNDVKLASGEKSTKLRSQAFYLLVEQIRSQRSSLTYARARKAASCKWRSLSENEKMVFRDEAAKTLEK